MPEIKEDRVPQKDEIDLIELAKSIWAGKIFIAITTSVFVAIGLLIAFTSPVEYEASCKLLPESQEGQMPNLGGLAGLAGFAGVDLSSVSGSTSGVLTPQLYPEIVNSLPFVLEVLNDTVYFEQINFKDTPYNYFKEISRPSVFDYILKYTVGLPGLIKKTIIEEENQEKKDSQYVRISKKDWNTIEMFKKRITVEIEAETNIIKISARMPDPYAAAEITKKVELMITKAVVDYKTEKSMKNLDFIEETFKESKKEFEALQLLLARTTDRNKNITSATAQIELKKIEHEYDVAFSVYKGLSSQVHQAKIKLKEETPVFTILEPVRIPEQKSTPNRTLIVLTSIFIGVLSSIAFISTKKLFLKI